MDARLVLARSLVLCLSVALVVAACGGTEAHPIAPEEPKRAISAEISDFEVSSDGVDRFASCPPSGDLGQAWIPSLPEWSPSPVKPTADGGVPAPLPVNATNADDRGRTATERAIEDTRSAFRSCYHRGLVLDPTQHGHVAIVARVGPDGRVQKVEAYAACEIVKETIICMQDAAKTLRFAPPRDGSDTIVLPTVFADRSGRTGRVNTVDTYTAAAYLAVEQVAPELHQCLDRAQREGRGLEAWAHFDLTLDEVGHVDTVNVDPFGGDQDLLQCAAGVMNKLRFPTPEVSHGHVIVRVRFNPRMGSR